MKHTHLILVSILLMSLLVGGVGAATWTNNTGAYWCWTSTDANPGYITVKWNVTGSGTWTPPTGVTVVDYVVVGAGGGAGGYVSGGGGGGSMHNGTLTGLSDSQNVIVGTGGSGGLYPATSAVKGGSSTFGSITAEGGGLGAGYAQASGNGASGGGGAENALSGGSATDPVYGYDGGAGGLSGAGGGGGGATEKGQDGVQSNYAGHGGAGNTTPAWSGSLQVCGGGGGGGNGVTTGTASYGGGAGVDNAAGINGYPNTGGGGGGTGSGSGNRGGAGGSGIVIIRYSTPPVASFNATNISVVTNGTSSGWSGIAPFTMQFNDSSTGSPTSWNWSATNVTGNNVPFVFNTTCSTPIYTFAMFGNYSIVLNATNTGGSNVSTQVTWVNVSSGVTAPVAAFNTTNISVVFNSTSSGWAGYAPLTMQFNDSSTNVPTGWNWSAVNTTGDNIPFVFNTTCSTPIYTFTKYGNYSIQLNATNDAGSNVSINQVSYVNVSVFPNFTSNITESAVYGMSVQFNDTSTGYPDTWNWSFGDGGSSTVRNATYIYDVARKYTVVMNASLNNGFNNTATKTNYINLSSDKDSNVKSWLHFNGANGGTTIIGEVGPAWLASVATTSTTQIKFGNASVAFQEDKSKVSTPSTNTLNLGSGNFTIELWAYPSSTTTSIDIILSRLSNVNAKTDGWAIYHASANTTSNAWKFYMGSAAANSTDIFTIAPNAWSHVVVERIDGVVSVYINGNRVTSKSIPGNYDTTNSIIYGYASGSSRAFRGYIDEARISTTYRWGMDHTSPVYEYAGDLYYTLPDINPYSTLRFKTDPSMPSNAFIANMTPRYRTLQIQNITHADNITVSTGFEPKHQFASGVLVNASTYNNINITYYNIDNINGIVDINLTRPGGFAAAGDTRVSFVDVIMNYYNYTQPGGQGGADQYFGYGTLRNATTGTEYPIHNFISTNVTFLYWDFFPNFTSNVTDVAKRFLSESATIQFNDTTVGYPNIWNYTWGDGTFTNGTERNATHTYTTMGTYTVNLTEYLWQNLSVTNMTSRTDYITIYNHTIADFSGTPLTGFNSVTVQFTDLSSNATTWNWSFGDGSLVNSTVQNPVHTFTHTGGNTSVTQFTVSLNASNTASEDFNITTKVAYVEVRPTYSANFYAAPLTGYRPLTVSFVDFSTGDGIASWNWSFGDGSLSTLANPSHEYLLAGVYSVDLNVSNWEGTYTNLTKTGYITVSEQPYEYSPQSTINFTQSALTIFNATPQVLISTIGNMTYNTTYVIGNVSFDNLHLKPKTIGVNNTIYNMSYEYAAGTNYINYTVWKNLTFDSNISAYGTDYKTLVDIDMLYYNYSNASTTSSLTHMVGSYNTSNNVSYNNFVQNISTTVNYGDMLLADFSANVTSQILIQPVSVQFNDTSNFMGTSWYWAFGDLGTSTTQNATHTYTTVGNYDVFLSVTNTSFGVNSTTKVGYIQVLPQPYEFSPISTIKFNQSSLTIVNATPRVLFAEVDNMTYNISYVRGNISFDNLHLKPKTIVVNNSQYNMSYEYTAGTNYINYTVWKNLTYDSNITAFGTDYKTLVDIDILYYNYSNTTAGMSSSLTHMFASYNTSNNVSYNNFVQNMSTTINYGDTLLADFSAVPTVGTSPMTVIFTDASNFLGTSWMWVFGDGDTTNNTVQNPVHTYATNANFTVSLSVTNKFGVNSTTKTGYIDTAPMYLSPNSTIGFNVTNITITNATPQTITMQIWNMSANVSYINGSIYYNRSHYMITRIAANTSGYSDLNITFTAIGNNINYTLKRVTADPHKISALNSSVKALLDLDVLYYCATTSATTTTEIYHTVAIYNLSYNTSYLSFVHSMPIGITSSGAFPSSYITNVSNSQIGKVRYLVNNSAMYVGPAITSIYNTTSTISGLDIPEAGVWIGVATGTTDNESTMHHIQILPTGFGTHYSGSASSALAGSTIITGDVTSMSTVDSASFSAVARLTNYGVYTLSTSRIGEYIAGGTIRSVDSADKNGLWSAFGGDDGKLYIFSRDASSSWYVYYQGDSVSTINAVTMSMRGEYVGVGRTNGYLEYYNVQSPAGLSTFLVDVFVTKDRSPYTNKAITVEKSDSTPFSWDAYTSGVTDSTGKYVFSVDDMKYYKVSVGTEYTVIYQASSTSSYRMITINIPTALTGVEYSYSGNYDEATRIMSVNYTDIYNVQYFNATWYNLTSNTLVHTFNVSTGTIINDSFVDNEPNSSYGNYKVILNFTRANGIPYGDTIYIHSTKMTKIPGTTEQMTIFKYALYTVMLMVIGLGVGSQSVKYGAITIVALAVLGLLIGFLPWSIYSLGIAAAAFIAITAVFRRNA